MKAVWLCSEISTFFVWATTPSAISLREPSEASRLYASCKYSAYPLTDRNYRAPNDPRQPTCYGFAPADYKSVICQLGAVKAKIFTVDFAPVTFSILAYVVPSFDFKKQNLFIFQTGIILLCIHVYSLQGVHKSLLLWFLWQLLISLATFLTLFPVSGFVFGGFCCC